MIDLDAYARWRAQIPFSDEEIAAMFERLAARSPFERARRYYLDRAEAARRGRVSAKDMRYVQYELIKVCSLCGKKALYKYGNFGRCTKHKDVKPGFMASRNAARAMKNAFFEKEVVDLSRLEKGGTANVRRAVRKELAGIDPHGTHS